MTRAVRIESPTGQNLICGTCALSIPWPLFHGERFHVGPGFSSRFFGCADMANGPYMILGIALCSPCTVRIISVLSSLPLVYGGYGLMGGTGVGLAYTPPVQTLISWFPDKKGLASGLTIAG